MLICLHGLDMLKVTRAALAAASLGSVVSSQVMPPLLAMDLFLTDTTVLLRSAFTRAACLHIIRLTAADFGSRLVKAVTV